MNFIRFSIEKPISVAVIVILLLIFGGIGISRLPVQLTPDVEELKITVRTVWPGASPYEIEKEIIEEQEKFLKGLRNLRLMESSCFNDYGMITLTFNPDSTLEDALLRTANKLEEVPSYPRNADKPIIEASGAQSAPVIWLDLVTTGNNTNHIDHYRTFFENEVRQHLERVKGVGSLFVYGGTEKQLDVIIDPVQMARHRITITDVITKLQQANQNISAGVLGIDKNNYRLRTVSQFQDPTDPLEVILFDDGVKRVRVRDIARTDTGYARKHVAVLLNEHDMIAVGVRKEQGANVVTLTGKVRDTVDRLNATILADNQLAIHWSYDQAPYILRAIDIVQTNLLIGGTLAIIVLLLFLRSIRATVATAVAIPISVVGCFIFLWLFDRNINVVSLAGISFAVGMLVDNSIVVLENIDRHLHMDKSAFDAVRDGTREVWGAVFASTITTVAVFLPIIFIRQEAGQLFKDIAIAIAFAIMLSLFVSVSVIPCIMFQLYRTSQRTTRQTVDRIGRVGARAGQLLYRLSAACLLTSARRIATIAGFTLASLVLVALLMPKAEYLPTGNQNLIFNIMIPPPGYSLQKRYDIGRYIYEQLRPHFKTDDIDGIPQIRDLWYVAADEITLFGSSAINARETESAKLIPLFTRIMNAIPGMFGISVQSGIFENDLGKGRTVDINISGQRIEEIAQVALQLFIQTQQRIPNCQVRPVPSLEIGYPEVTFTPDKQRLAASGLTESDLGIYIDVLMDGRKIDDFRPEGVREIDLVLKGDDRRFRTPEDTLDSMIVNRNGQLIRIGDVADITYTTGMMQIDHLERVRNIRLEVTPPDTMALQEAMEIIENQLVAQMVSSGAAGRTSITVGGNADKLTETRQALQWNFLLAVVITYLLMAALFENFLYPLIIMFTVPLAAGGGFIGLSLINTLVAPQPFDVLTMLGFIILVGTVVNNAILIVHQTLNNIRYDGMQGLDAIRESVRTRIRPIFMSATTTIFGMLPLVLSTGAGSELYRGLGSVLLGGLALSTLLTLCVIPALLAFCIRFERPRGTP